MMDKTRLMQAFLARIRGELQAVTDSQKATVAGATHEESRAENDKDTRALESTYLARGLARRVVELQEAVGRLEQLKPRDFGPDDPIALTALVTLEEEGRQRRHLLVPAGGGILLEFDGEEIMVLSSHSPMGRALLGRHLDEDLDVVTPQGKRELSIVDIA